MEVPLAHAYEESEDGVYCPQRCLPPHALYTSTPGAQRSTHGPVFV
jgi:hypothetical protein